MRTLVFFDIALAVLLEISFHMWHFKFTLDEMTQCDLIIRTEEYSIRQS